MTFKDNRKNRRSFIPVLLLLPALLAGCSSVKVDRGYFPDGNLKEIKTFTEGKLASTVLFEYDKSGRPKKVSQFVPGKEEPVSSMIFVREPQGKLAVYSYQLTVREGNKAVRDIGVESYFYNTDQRLSRIEASFKSSYSIAKNRTALLIARLFYADGRVDTVKINGGTFTREMKLSYRRDSLSQIEYRFSAWDGRKRNFDLTKNYLFYLDDGDAVKADNLLTKKKVDSGKETRRIFREEDIMALLRKVRSSADFKTQMKELEEHWKNNPGLP